MSLIARNALMGASQLNKAVSTIFVTTPSSLVAVDVTDATNPTIISTLTTGVGNFNGSDRAVYSHKRKQLFVTGWSPSTFGTTNRDHIYSIDVSDSSSMSVDEDKDMNRYFTSLALDNDNDVLYGIRYSTNFSSPESTLSSIDVSDPTAISVTDETSFLTDTNTPWSSLALDLGSKLAIAASSDQRGFPQNTIYYRAIFDIQNPASLSRSDIQSNVYSYSISGNLYEKVTLNPNGKIAYLSEKDNTITYSYSGGTFGAAIDETLDNGGRYGRSFYRARDAHFFTGDSPAALMGEIRSHDEFRSIGFATYNDTSVQCIDLSTPSSPSILGQVSISNAFDIVPAVDSPSATNAYR